MRSSQYKWVIEALLILGLFGQNLIWLAPAPILRPIITDLGISLASGGLIISIIALCISIFAFVGAVVTRRLGVMPTLLIGLWMLALAAIGSGYSSSFAQLLLCRIVEGVGFGLMTAPPGILAMQWFSEKEWPYINMVNALCAYVGLTAVFTMTPPIYFALGASWRAVLCDYGIGFAVVALAWTLLGREKTNPQAAVGAQDGAGVWEVLMIRKLDRGAADHRDRGIRCRRHRHGRDWFA